MDRDRGGRKRMHGDAQETRASYDAVAEAYADEFFDELSRKPFDRALLDVFAQRCTGQGLVLDVGCGPGHVARYLNDRGVQVGGVDLSPVMVDVARRLNRGLTFSTGDMRALAAPSASLAGIAAFYSVIHVARSEAAAVFDEFHRVLQPGGHLLLAVHGGSASIYRDEFLGRPVPFEATLFSLGEVVSGAEASGFWVDEARQRVPYAFEHPTPRIYLVAHRDG